MIISLGFLLVLFMRIGGPLLMFRWPLAGGLLSEYVFDSLDVIIWDFTGALSVINYTQSDKSLDMIQLFIMAILVWKTWTSPKPRRIALFLFVFRLVGFMLYEIIHARVLFIIFPNIFTLFYFAYLVAKKCGKKDWFENSASLVSVFAILLLLKMPQEYMLHYAQFKPWTALKGLIA